MKIFYDCMTRVFLNTKKAVIAIISCMCNTVQFSFSLLRSNFLCIVCRIIGINIYFICYLFIYSSIHTGDQKIKTSCTNAE